jgi:hypothetical protein
VGKLEPDGGVRVNGSLPGRIERDGTVRKNGSIIRSVQGVPAAQAAAIFFWGFSSLK